MTDLSSLEIPFSGFDLWLAESTERYSDASLASFRFQQIALKSFGSIPFRFDGDLPVANEQGGLTKEAARELRLTSEALPLGFLVHLDHSITFFQAIATRAGGFWAKPDGTFGCCNEEQLEALVESEVSRTVNLAACVGIDPAHASARARSIRRYFFG